MREPEEKEDRISNLPDSIIHHILSLLPSTNEAVQTSVLSKRWQNQWTHVTVLNFVNSTFMFNRNVNWAFLTTLNMEGCKLTNLAMENIISGSPLLESFELINCDVVDRLDISSKSLKRLVLRDFQTFMFDIEISSCPKLEELYLFGSLNFVTAKLLDLPSLLCATLDFYVDWYDGCSSTYTICASLIKDILQQLQHVKELTIGNWFIKILSIKEGRQFSLLLNVKHLTLNSPYLNKHVSGIAFVLGNSPFLQKLVVNKLLYEQLYDLIPFFGSSDDLPKFNNFGENYWNSNVIIKIIGFLEDDKRNLVVRFVQFLLKNAIRTQLEKMVIVLKDDGTAFLLENIVSQEWLSLPQYDNTADILSFYCLSNY